MNRIVELQPGNTVIEQNEPGDGFYVLLSGNLEVYRDKIYLCSLNQRGTIFGEMSGILCEPRTCSIIAKNDVKVIFVSNDDMIEFIQETPDIGVKIIKTLARRLAATSRKYVVHAEVQSPATVELRGRRIKENLLDNLEGLGPARRRALDLEFETIDNLKEASIEALMQVEGIGPKMAQQLHKVLRKL